ncbi:Proto-oncogene tyrosine-protein kinase receptor Ret [Gryllus bimaculatus]|nr:Proto-oncogene tyrosine-protein kinase receptor Ret [Gryllus bimaculatus]
MRVVQARTRNWRKDGTSRKKAIKEEVEDVEMDDDKCNAASGAEGGGGGLYFPLAELALRVPPQVPAGALLLRVRALRRDGPASSSSSSSSPAAAPGPSPTAAASAAAPTAGAAGGGAGSEPAPGQVAYSLRQPAADGTVLSVSSSSGELRLADGVARKDGEWQTNVLLLATEPGVPSAELRLNVTLLPSDGKTLDCDSLTQELCFWPAALYAIPENRPSSLLGPLGPPYLSELCPQHNLSYTLGNGPALSFTDADTLEPNSYTFTVLNDDAGLFLLPECAQDQAEHLGRERTAIACRLEVAKTANPPEGRDPYSIVMQANDTSLAPGVAPVSHVDVMINVHSGAAPTTEPTMMMKMKMISTTSMMMNQMSTSDMMTMESSMMTTDMSSMMPLLPMPEYPSKAKVLRSATAYARVVQPDGPLAAAADVTASGQPALRFWIPQKEEHHPLDVTQRGGIVYVSDATALRSAPGTIMLEIMWNSTSGGGRGGSAKIEITLDNSSSTECSPKMKKSKDTMMKNVTSKDSMGKDEMNSTKIMDMKGMGGKEMKNDSMKDDPMKNNSMAKDSMGENSMTKGSVEDMMPMDNMDMPPTCASRGTMKSCVSLCGLGTGAKGGQNSASRGGCAWRSRKSGAGTPSQQYATCSPDIATCPDGVCDPLEDMHPGLCPQDCSMMESTSANATRGIVGGSGVCTCDATARCSCMSATKPPQHPSTSAPMMQSTVAAAPLNTDCPNKGGSPSCGGLCQLFLILVSLLIIAGVIAILLWRYKKRHGSLSCPSCPACPPLPCTCPPRFCQDCACKNDALFSWLPKRLQRPPPPAVAPTPTSRVSSEFEHSGLQSVDAHLLPYGYMAPLGQLHPMHK